MTDDRAKIIYHFDIIAQNWDKMLNFKVNFAISRIFFDFVRKKLYRVVLGHSNKLFMG